MTTPGYAQIARDGLWNNNPALAQLLGLCPLLAVSGTVVNAVGLGIATTLVLVATNLTVSLIRRAVPQEVRIAVFVLVIAAFVTVVELLMNAYFHSLYKVLGIFVPLIVTNCAIIGRAEAFASKHAPERALFDGLAMGAGFTLALMALGALRELLGHGTLFGGAQIMLGTWAAGLELEVISGYRGFLLAVLPPGAFFGLGLLVAIKNVIDQKRKERVRRRVEVPMEAEAAG